MKEQTDIPGELAESTREIRDELREQCFAENKEVDRSKPPFPFIMEENRSLLSVGGLWQGVVPVKGESLDEAIASIWGVYDTIQEQTDIIELVKTACDDAAAVPDVEKLNRIMATVNHLAHASILVALAVKQRAAGHVDGALDSERQAEAAFKKASEA